MGDGRCHLMWLSGWSFWQARDGGTRGSEGADDLEENWGEMALGEAKSEEITASQAQRCSMM